MKKAFLLLTVLIMFSCDSSGSDSNPGGSVSIDSLTPTDNSTIAANDTIYVSVSYTIADFDTANNKYYLSLNMWLNDQDTLGLTEVELTSSSGTKNLSYVIQSFDLDQTSSPYTFEITIDREPNDDIYFYVLASQEWIYY